MYKILFGFTQLICLLLPVIADHESASCIGPYCPSFSYPDRFVDSKIPCNETGPETFTDAVDCHSFYLCSKDKENATKLTCPNGYGYHEEWNICVPENQVQLCKSKVFCPAYIYDGVIPDPKDCRFFYRCYYGFPQRDKCPRKSTFEAESGLCKFYKKGQEPACLTKPITPVVTTMTPTEIPDATTTEAPTSTPIET